MCVCVCVCVCVGWLGLLAYRCLKKCAYTMCDQTLSRLNILYITILSF